MPSEKQVISYINKQLEESKSLLSKISVWVVNNPFTNYTSAIESEYGRIKGLKDVLYYIDPNYNSEGTVEEK